VPAVQARAPRARAGAQRPRPRHPRDTFGDPAAASRAPRGRGVCPAAATCPPSQPPALRVTQRGDRVNGRDLAAGSSRSGRCPRTPAPAEPRPGRGPCAPADPVPPRAAGLPRGAAGDTIGLGTIEITAGILGSRRSGRCSRPWRRQRRALRSEGRPEEGSSGDAAPWRFQGSDALAAAAPGRRRLAGGRCPHQRSGTTAGGGPGSGRLGDPGQRRRGRRDRDAGQRSHPGGSGEGSSASGDRAAAPDGGDTGRPPGPRSSWDPAGRM